MSLISVLGGILYLLISLNIFGVFVLVGFIYGVISLIVYPLGIMGVISEETKQNILIISPFLVGVLILFIGFANQNVNMSAFGFGVSVVGAVIGAVLTDTSGQKKKLKGVDKNGSV